MQAVVERVMRAFAIKHPLGKKAGTAPRDPAEFAAELLENYRALLSQREAPPQTH
ncbi:MAG: hypothetical protein ACTHN2_13360 [Nitrobacter sp.]